MSESVNSDDDTTLTESHNATVTETDLSSDTTVDGSFNGNVSDDDYVDVDVAPVDEAPNAVHESGDLWPTEDTDAAGLDADASVSE
jgi:hypothetical protein